MSTSWSIKWQYLEGRYPQRLAEVFSLSCVEWVSVKQFLLRIPPDSKFLLGALVFTFLCHGAALIATLVFLLPGLPSGHNDLAHRVSYIGQHALIWRIGWLPWQLTALSDLILAVALVRTSWISRPAAFISLGLTVTALLIEQPAEFRWTTSGVELARQAFLMQNASSYSAFESEIFRLTSYWAAFFYTLAAIAWSVCLAKAGTWNRFMTILSIILWGLLIVISLGPLLLDGFPAIIVSSGNAIGFNVMMVWFGVATYLIWKNRRIED